MSKSNLKDIILLGGGLLVGGGAGYFIAQKTLRKKYQDIANQQIDEMREHWSSLRKDGEFETPTRLMESRHPELDGLKELVEDAGYDTVQIGETSTDGPQKTDYNIFRDGARSQPEFSGIDVEDLRPVPHQNKKIPHVISVDDFQDDGDLNYDKVAYTYFEKDDTLIDEREAIVPDIEGSLGRANLEFFGYESDDDAIVYIRNPRISIDFEVTRHQGGYTEVILGQPDPDDLIDKKPRGVKKMRPESDTERDD